MPNYDALKSRGLASTARAKQGTPQALNYAKETAPNQSTSFKSDREAISQPAAGVPTKSQAIPTGNTADIPKA